MRAEIRSLIELGPLPAEDVADPERIGRCERLLEGIIPPVTDDEARALAKLFGPDNAFGLAWSLVHLIETAPSWPLQDSLQGDENVWIRYLQERVENARKRLYPAR